MNISNETKTKPTTEEAVLPMYSLEQLLKDKTPAPEDIIAPRVLVPGGNIAFGGPRSVGKTDLLLAWSCHLAAGESFLGMKPPRPLRVCYWHTETQAQYFDERIESMQVCRELSDHKNNLAIAADCETILNKEGVQLISDGMRNVFHDGKVDIIVIDSLNQVFDGTQDDLDSWVRMRDFERDRLDALRDAVNPDCGIILAFETKPLTKEMMRSDPFYELGELRPLSCCDISMFYPDADSSRRKLVFELNYGPPIADKVIDKVDGKWFEVEHEAHV